MAKVRRKNKTKLIYTMTGMLILCWLTPLMIFVYILLSFMTGSMSTQIERTIITSFDKAVDICVMQIDDVAVDSRNASYMNTIKDAYTEYQNNGMEQDLYNTVTTFLTQQYKYNENIGSAMLYFLDNPGEIYYATGVSTPSDYLNVKQFQNSYQGHISEAMADGDTGVKVICFDEKLFMVRNMMDSYFEPFAVLCLELNAESVFEGLNSVWGANGFKVYVDNCDIITMGEYNETNLIDTTKDRDKVGLSSEYIQKGGEAYAHKVVKIGGAYISINICLDSQAILDDVGIIQIMFILLAVFMVVLLLIIFGFLYKKVNKPISNLVAGAEEIAQGKYGHKIDETGGSFEFDNLEKSFNAMSMELKRQFERIYLEELELRDAQIMALQSQINPHFLNNTLEIINWECRMTGNTKASSMIEALSVMLNATMNRKKQNMIPLAEELSYVDAYLLIIQQRFGNRLKIKKKIDDSVLTVEVPRLIIQPIIENAVEHGIDSKNQGKVKIDIYTADGKIYIDVINNGALTEEDRKKIDYLLGPDFKEGGERSTSLGIRNVNRRLKIIYGEEYGLSIFGNEDGYTLSRITVDMNYKKEEEDNEKNNINK